MFIGLSSNPSARRTLISFIYLSFFVFRFHEIFYYTGRFDQRCLSSGTIRNRLRCYDVGGDCDLDFWDPACWKIGTKMKSVETAMQGILVVVSRTQRRLLLLGLPGSTLYY